MTRGSMRVRWFVISKLNIPAPSEPDPRYTEPASSQVLNPQTSTCLETTNRHLPGQHSSSPDREVRLGTLMKQIAVRPPKWLRQAESVRPLINRPKDDNWWLSRTKYFSVSPFASHSSRIPGSSLERDAKHFKGGSRGQHQVCVCVCVFYRARLLRATTDRRPTKRQ